MPAKKTFPSPLSGNGTAPTSGNGEGHWPAPTSGDTYKIFRHSP